MAYIDKSMILLVHVSLVLVLVVIFIGQVLYCTPFSTKNCELIVIGNSFAALICVCCLFKIYLSLQLEITVKVWNLNSWNPNLSEIQFCEFRFQTALCVWNTNFGFQFQTFHKSVWNPNQKAQISYTFWNKSVWKPNCLETEQLLSFWNPY